MHTIKEPKKCVKDQSDPAPDFEHDSLLAYLSKSNYINDWL